MQVRARRYNVAMVTKIPEPAMLNRLRGFAVLAVTKMKIPAAVLAPLVVGMSLMYLGMEMYLKMNNTASTKVALTKK